MLTEDKIAEQVIIALKENLKQVFPVAEDFNEKEGYYEALADNKVIGYATLAESQGYSSVLKIMVGMDLDKKITGMRVMEQVETPGLGANAVKEEFYSQFDGLSSKDVKLKKDHGKIDAITGATITSSAVIKGVNDAMINKLEKLVDGDYIRNDIKDDEGFSKMDLDMHSSDEDYGICNGESEECGSEIFEDGTSKDDIYKDDSKNDKESVVDNE